MGKTFFEELNNESATGVAYKNLNLKKSILGYFANVSDATIADLAKELNISVPKMTALLNDLIQDGIVQDYGKVESKSGRKPNLFGLLPESAFFIGVDINQRYINVALSDLQKNLVKVAEKIPYKLENNKESLETLCQLINTFIKELPIPKDKILGIGINISGRVNYATGYSYSFFNFSEEPLSKIIESKVGIKVFLENDSRAMAFGEFSSGIVKGEKDVLFLNIDYGIGLGILINGQLYYGKSGYSGEFGHIPLFDNEILCHCGKKGCLETEASGWALARMVKQKMQEGSSSILFEEKGEGEEIQMEDVIKAANNDDVLAIELIAEIGGNIGRGIALLINIFNPELVILGGSLAQTGEYIRLPIKSAINKYSLSLVNNDTQLRLSQLGKHAGIIGACLLVRKRLLSLH
ncbi:MULTISPECIES: ROK family transcriptional regulator [unclassified Mucilaginibacter]|uniref:ROK family transcriptional regulator n=1 Tax=unclassified Mucilaginibacter TaxID=2617802 RepID=UPI002AC8EE88|nr:MULTISPECIES: ROK family transcriptional regulator [unclassified Mucilaginibacter]MEB0263278.1 ROK family transcriptional regulator [Mucilaginibacter sp. 10I4]MEB0278234.1 ROK family transcriptional regulator [Mucilaginibacter sp. 10B2]MEB0300980.1 ROK family transcriptional regulator [Mucilaginibacter sp. 5C4]WPX23879.1 ROK family transcriptional regulator [Mucilaginibacter sp. 5C4]